MFKSIVLSLVLVTVTSATDDVTPMDDGSGADMVTAAQMVGQVLLSARFLGLGLDGVSEQFPNNVVDELRVAVKKVTGNYEMVTDGERKLFEDAIVIVAQAQHNAQYVHKSLTQLGSDIVDRLRMLRHFITKALNPSSNLRLQQVGIKYMVVKSMLMLKSLMDPLSEATKYHASMLGELTAADTLFGNFTAVIASMADTEGDRFKNMNKDWIDLYFGQILSTKMKAYWAYVQPTLKGMKLIVDKSEATLAAAEQQGEALRALASTLMTAGQTMGAKYEDYMSGDEFSKPIDLDEFNSKYSIVHLDTLQAAAQRLADL